jgi:nucleotide-binding universal stress UspA family protein
MALPKRLLVATDFSEQGDHASDVALEWAERLGGEVHWVHGTECLARVTPPAAEPLIASYIEQSRHLGQERLAAPVARARERGLVSDAHIVDAPVAAAVAELAAELAADCIVVGTHGHTGLSHALLGSVAERIVRDAPCRVLVVRGSRSPLSEPTIVLGDDLTTVSTPARADAEALARELGARLDVVHAVEAGIPYLATLELVLPKDMFGRLHEDAVQRLEQAASESPEVQVSNLVTSERPAGAICDLAEKVDASPAVVGSSSRRGMDRVLLGSVAERVVRRAPCSVLVVR